jgi:hypothetical protein
MTYSKEEFVMSLAAQSQWEVLKAHYRLHHVKQKEKEKFCSKYFESSFR